MLIFVFDNSFAGMLCDIFSSLMIGLYGPNGNSGQSLASEQITTYI